MAVPFEALIPYAIMIGAFGVTGVGLATSRWLTNGGKAARYGVDRWDRTDNPVAPAGFELNNAWTLEKRYF